MNNVWKILISLVLILIIGGTGAAYYFFKIKTYDVADEEVEKITKTDYEIILPDENGSSAIEEKINETKKQAESSEPNKGSIKNEENSSGTNTAEANTAAANVSTSAAYSSTDKKTGNKSSSNQSSSLSDKETGSTSKDSGQDTVVKEVTVANIKEKYYLSFEYLQIQANSKIDALISQAYGEFQTKRNNGETISFSYFYQKYSSASASLESSTDAAFNIIYSALQDDLKKNGFSPSHANSFKEEYETAKDAREAAILNKVREAL